MYALAYILSCPHIHYVSMIVFEWWEGGGTGGTAFLTLTFDTNNTNPRWTTGTARHRKLPTIRKLTAVTQEGRLGV